jgi:Spy/CpxP family protein refolding chaperone
MCVFFEYLNALKRRNAGAAAAYTAAASPLLLQAQSNTGTNAPPQKARQTHWRREERHAVACWQAFA